MNRSKLMIRLALHGAQSNYEESSVLVEEQMEILHSEKSSRTGSPMAVSPMEVQRDSPLTVEQRETIAEMENLGFIEDNFNDPVLYSNKSPLSVFTADKDFDLQESNVLSIEKPLTPLFTPIASIQSLLETPNSIETSRNTSNVNLNNSKHTFIDDSDDSVADPNYQPEDEEIQCSPMSPIPFSSLGSTEPPANSITSPEIEELPTRENILNCQVLKRRKRKMPENWKKNIRKNKRNSGETYTSTQGKNVPAKICSNENCKCQRACHTKIDNDTRQNLHLSFWGLGSIERQRDFIVSNVYSTEATKSRVTNSRRKFTLNYMFKVDSELVNVCQPFFLRTLDISDKMVRTALSKSRRGTGNIPSPDKRGHHPPSNKLDSDSMKFAIDHIDSFPKVPSHWCRKNTKKVYLETTMNKEKMYDLYKQHCLENNKNPIGKTSYKELLLEKNIGFHKPRKDQCWCNKYEQLSEEEQKEKQAEYEEHVNRKYYAQEEKKADKMKAIEDNRLHVCTFDFEAVLYCPLVLGKPVFYKRKLGSMNFTIHNAATKQGYCYFWPEYEGNRGSNEVSTCLYNYISRLTDVDHLVLYSDCCPGQNRNSVVVAMLHCIITSPENNISIIDYKFLEPGHTYMECDNMHSTIERASEYAKIYTPDDWQNVIRLARKDNPYCVQVMNHTDFLNFKTFRSTIIPNTLKATDGTVLQWANVRWLRLNKDIPNSFFFKFDYWEELKEVKLKGRVTRSERNTHLAKLYSEQVLLKQVKHTDLLALCRDGTIPRNHHYFYENLPVKSVSESSPQTRPRQDDDELELSATRAAYLRRRSGRNN